jgi:hypothetical protein
VINGAIADESQNLNSATRSSILPTVLFHRFHQPDRPPLGRGEHPSKLFGRSGTQRRPDRALRMQARQSFSGLGFYPIDASYRHFPVEDENRLA